MWESKTVMLTLLKRSFLCFVECNVKYLNTASSESWNTHPSGQSQPHPCSLCSHKYFASSNNSWSVKHSSLLPLEKVTTSVLRRGLEHHEEESKVNVTLSQWSPERKDESLLSSWKKGHRRPLEGGFKAMSSKGQIEYSRDPGLRHKPYRTVMFKVHSWQYYSLGVTDGLCLENMGYRQRLRFLHCGKMYWA